MVDGVDDVGFSCFYHRERLVVIVDGHVGELQPGNALDVFEEHRGDAGVFSRSRIGVGKRGSERVVSHRQRGRVLDVCVLVAREYGILPRVDAEVRFVELGEVIGIANQQAVGRIVDSGFQVVSAFRDGNVERFGRELRNGFVLRVDAEVGYGDRVELALIEGISEKGRFAEGHDFD